MSKSSRYARGKEIIELSKMRGCDLCGESDLSVLDHHHRNPEEKLFNLSGAACNKPPEKLYAEIVKCLVLCANCHRRVHAGLIELPVGDEDEQSDQSSQFRRNHGGASIHDGR